MVHLFRGTHNPAWLSDLQQIWEKNQLAIFVPVTRTDFSFLNGFQWDEVQLHGDWPEALARSIPSSSVGSKSVQGAVLAVFTSGTTTGVGRLVFLNKENVRTSLEGIRELFQTDRIRKIFCYPQPNHVFGVVLGYLQAMIYGTELIVAPGPYSREAHQFWLDNVDADTLTLGTPTHFFDLIRYVKASGCSPPTSYSAIVGGASASQSLWRDLQTVLKIEKPSVGYGASECAPGVTHLPPGQPPIQDGDIGMPLKNVKLDVQGENGVVIRGPNVCMAMLNGIDLTFPTEIRLSDSIERDESSGRFVFRGRTDSILNRGGLKLSLDVIENQISAALDCRCMAVPFYDERLGQDFGVIAEGVTSLETLSETLRAKAGVSLSPQNLLLEKVPLNANGKFDRRAGSLMMLKRRTWKLPISVRYLESFLPHRDSAVWIDTLVETAPGRGTALVQLRQTANYFSGSRLRESACVEWVAQAYGYIRAYNEVAGVQAIKPANRVAIIEVKDAEFFCDQHRPPVGAELRIVCHCKHEFGSLSLIEGQVFHGENLLAVTSLKVFNL